MAQKIWNKIKDYFYGMSWKSYESKRFGICFLNELFVAWAIFAIIWANFYCCYLVFFFFWLSIMLGGQDYFFGRKSIDRKKFLKFFITIDMADY